MTKKKEKTKKVEEVKEKQKVELPENIKRISDLIPDDIKIEIDKLATEHINWLFEILWPLLHTEFTHGARHGYELRHNLKEDLNNLKDLDVKGFTRKLDKMEEKILKKK